LSRNKAEISLPHVYKSGFIFALLGLKNVQTAGEEVGPALLDNITMCGRVCDRQTDTLKFFLKRIR
jgi:hypothetical protein